MHQLSVTSDIDSVISCLPSSKHIRTRVGKNTVTFFSDREKEISCFKEFLAEAIASVIDIKYRPSLIRQTLSTKYKHLKPSEQTKILSSLEMEGAMRDYDALVSELSSFLASSDTISIEGFVNFRLPAYKRHIVRDVDSAVGRFAAQREYDEFISLLEYFVECRPPRENHLHIVVTQNGGFSIYNEDLREITADCAREIADMYEGDEISFDDILLSALISIAPLKITFHNSGFIKTPNLLATIKQVFKGRVFFCQSCNLCNQKQ